MDLSHVKAVLARNAHLYTAAYVYGSTARGDDDEWSDVDLILIRRTYLPFFDRIRELMDIVLSLGRADVLVYTQEELKELLEERENAFLLDTVAKGVRIEGAQDGCAPVAPAG